MIGIEATRIILNRIVRDQLSNRNALPRPLAWLRENRKHWNNGIVGCVGPATISNRPSEALTVGGCVATATNDLS